MATKCWLCASASPATGWHRRATACRTSFALTSVRSSPVAVAALAWTLISLFSILVSNTTLAALLIVVGLLLVGLAYFLYMWKFDREVLEHEPGEPDLFTEPAK